MGDDWADFGDGFDVTDPPKEGVEGGAAEEEGADDWDFFDVTVREVGETKEERKNRMEETWAGDSSFLDGVSGDSGALAGQKVDSEEMSLGACGGVVGDGSGDGAEEEISWPEFEVDNSAKAEPEAGREDSRDGGGPPVEDDLGGQGREGDEDDDVVASQCLAAGAWGSNDITDAGADGEVTDEGRSGAAADGSPSWGGFDDTMLDGVGGPPQFGGSKKGDPNSAGNAISIGRDNMDRDGSPDAVKSSTELDGVSPGQVGGPMHSSDAEIASSASPIRGEWAGGGCSADEENGVLAPLKRNGATLLGNQPSVQPEDVSPLAPTAGDNDWEGYSDAAGGRGGGGDNIASASAEKNEGDWGGFGGDEEDRDDSIPPAASAGGDDWGGFGEAAGGGGGGLGGSNMASASAEKNEGDWGGFGGDGEDGGDGTRTSPSARGDDWGFGHSDRDGDEVEDTWGGFEEETSGGTAAERGNGDEWDDFGDFGKQNSGTGDSGAGDFGSWGSPDTPQPAPPGILPTTGSVLIDWKPVDLRHARGDDVRRDADQVLRQAFAQLGASLQVNDLSDSAELWGGEDSTLWSLVSGPKPTSCKQCGAGHRSGARLCTTCGDNFSWVSRKDIRWESMVARRALVEAVRELAGEKINRVMEPSMVLCPTRESFQEAHSSKEGRKPREGFEEGQRSSKEGRRSQEGRRAQGNRSLPEGHNPDDRRQRKDGTWRARERKSGGDGDQPPPWVISDKDTQPKSQTGVGTGTAEHAKKGASEAPSPVVQEVGGVDLCEGLTSFDGLGLGGGFGDPGAVSEAAVAEKRGGELDLDFLSAFSSGLTGAAEGTGTATMDDGMSDLFNFDEGTVNPPAEGPTAAEAYAGKPAVLSAPGDTDVSAIVEEHVRMLPNLAHMIVS